MPGVIMDNGDRNGSNTNHDRDQRPNGVNGGGHVLEKPLDKGKGKEPQQNLTPTSPKGPHTSNGAIEPTTGVGQDANVSEQARLHELPPEVVHITQGFMSLSSLVTRIAQKTHVDLSATIQDLAQLSLPASVLNGNASHGQADDKTAENVEKKRLLLAFVQNAHADWAKAYVLTNWSKSSDEVGKLIDLTVTLKGHVEVYHNAVRRMGAIALELGGTPNQPGAAIPNPDLKTALEVLATGKAPWMPELGYIQHPPLTSKDLLKTIENLDTLLTIRMNLHEYDKIPWHFKNFEIKSGRVTFKVAGEFEVDLGIVDDDPASQFWFIDLRFLFSPSVTGLPLNARIFIENRVNVLLAKDGLLGCYNYLHEMVLTHKITEFRNQALRLASRKWIDTLKIELLNRSIAIQYWVDRYAKGASKSWIIIGVHSGTREDGRPDPKTASRLSLRWFRNAKEVKDVEIPLNTVAISTLSLLKTIISMHVNSILTATFDKLQIHPVFAKNEAQLSLTTSDTDPAESTLKVQLTTTENLTVKIDLITGRFVFSPPSNIITRGEYVLNNGSQDPASDAHGYIEKLRGMVILDDFVSHGLTAGWIRDNGPKLNPDELKSKLGKLCLQIVWFRRASWLQNWYAVLTISNVGERWFLVETIDHPPNITGNMTSILQSTLMPLKGSSPVSTYAFFSRLNIFTAGLISQCVNLRSLHSRKARHTLHLAPPTSSIRMPSILLRLSELLPSKNKSARTQKAWAKDSVRLTFHGLEPGPPVEFIPTVPPVAPVNAKAKARPSLNPPNSVAADTTIARSPAVGVPPVSQAASIDAPRPFGPGEGVIVITEARMNVPVPIALTTLKEKLDRDLAFDAKSGSFAFRLRTKVGETVIPIFIERAIRVERLVDFVEVLHKHEKTLSCESISLGRIAFTYGNNQLKTYKVIVDFGSTDSLMTLHFDLGNPHLRIADNLTKILNERQGLDGVANFLSLTISALRALDKLEEEWTTYAGKGEALIFVRAVEWYFIRYNIPSTQAQMRKISFEIRLQHRQGQPWWHVRRVDPRDRDGDDLDAALKSVWNSHGPGWEGKRLSGVAKPAGIEEMLEKLDSILRDFASGTLVTPSAQDPTPAQVKPPQRAPEAPMMAQRQQPTPNQSQSQGRNTPQNIGRNTPQNQGRNSPNSQGQSQGRNSNGKREIVEID